MSNVVYLFGHSSQFCRLSYRSHIRHMSRQVRYAVHHPSAINQSPLRQVPTKTKLASSAECHLILSLIQSHSNAQRGLINGSNVASDDRGCVCMFVCVCLFVCVCMCSSACVVSLCRRPVSSSCAAIVSIRAPLVTFDRIFGLSLNTTVQRNIFFGL